MGARTRWRSAALDLVAFGWQQALSCVFAAGVLVTLAVTTVVPTGLPRYDAILVVCLLLQVALVATGLETLDELRVICLFHLLGLGLEVFKVAVGSWAYPDAGLLRIGDVPLYSGFMYAAVASYMCQSWRRLHLDVDPVPMGPLLVLAAALYANFFTHHWWPDLRWVLVAAVVVVLRRTWVRFTVRGRVRRMPLVLSFALIGLFVWVAENAATLAGAWAYPSQAEGWSMVHAQKIGSWGVLVVFSFALVLWLKQAKGVPVAQAPRLRVRP